MGDKFTKQPIVYDGKLICLGRLATHMIDLKQMVAKSVDHFGEDKAESVGVKEWKA